MSQKRTNEYYVVYLSHSSASWIINAFSVLLHFPAFASQDGWYHNDPGPPASCVLPPIHMTSIRATSSAIYVSVQWVIQGGKSKYLWSFQNLVHYSYRCFRIKNTRQFCLWVLSSRNFLVLLELKLDWWSIFRCLVLILLGFPGFRLPQKDGAD